MTFFLALLLLAQTTIRASGLTYEDEQSYVAQGKADVLVFAVANCGKPYFGTICD